MREIVSTTTEWKARLNHYFRGADEYLGDGTEESARLYYEGKREHLDSLNEPTRRMGGVHSVDLVSREVTRYADGSRLITDWTVRS